MEKNFESKIIPFPQAQAVDPMLERALFFADLEHTELTSRIPQAEAAPSRAIY